MSDRIDELLRRDAVSWEAPPPPDFDVAVDAVTGRQRRRAITWLAAAAAVAIVGTAAGLVATRGGDRSPIPAGHEGSPTPGHTTSTGQTVPPIVDPIPTAAVLDPKRGARVLDLLIQISPLDLPCSGAVNATAWIASQSAKSVRVKVHASSRVRVRRRGSASISLSCLGGDTLSWVPLRLAQPLGSRMLRANGRAMPVLPATAPVPSYLPRGFRVVYVQHPDLSVASPGPPQSLVAATTYDDMRKFGPPTLTVREGPSDELPAGAKVRGRTTIDGNAARFMGGRPHDSGDPLCLTWLTGQPSVALRATARQVCMDVMPPYTTLATARHQLLRVARSLAPAH